MTVLMSLVPSRRTPTPSQATPGCSGILGALSTFNPAQARSLRRLSGWKKQIVSGRSTEKSAPSMIVLANAVPSVAMAVARQHARTAKHDGARRNMRARGTVPPPHPCACHPTGRRYAPFPVQEHRVAPEAQPLASAERPTTGVHASRSAAQVQLRRFLRGCIVVPLDEASAQDARTTRSAPLPSRATRKTVRDTRRRDSSRSGNPQKRAGIVVIPMIPAVFVRRRRPKGGTPGVARRRAREVL
jgi:hypothetical protein